MNLKTVIDCETETTEHDFLETNALDIEYRERVAWICPVVHLK